MLTADRSRRRRPTPLVAAPPRCGINVLVRAWPSPNGDLDRKEPTVSKRRRHWLLPAALLWASVPLSAEDDSPPSATPSSPREVRFVDGSSIAVQHYEVQEKLVLLVTPEGKLHSVPRSFVDVEATIRENHAVAEESPSPLVLPVQDPSPTRASPCPSGTAGDGGASDPLAIPAGSRYIRSIECGASRHRRPAATGVAGGRFTRRRRTFHHEGDPARFAADR